MELSLEMRGITKTYPGVVANDNVSISAEKGTVLCIIGENGAGKSTLMNVLYGMEKPDAGTILLNGQEVSFASSRDAMKHKIGMVFQHFMLVKELSCLENIIIGMEPRKDIRINYRKARSMIEDIMERYGMPIPLDTPAGELWVGLQQKLEIVKTLYRGAEVIILDEPTAVLTPQETEELFINIRKLAAMGKTILLITHKLDEVMQVADNIVVMRAGRVVAALNPEQTDIDDLALHMVGHELPPMHERKQAEGEKVLELRDVCALHRDGSEALRHINLHVGAGEILGVAGISGNGQGELAQLIAGLRRPSAGSVMLNGQDITGHDRRSRLLDGVSYIPEDRNTTGVCPPWSVEDNCFAGYHIQNRFLKPFGVINRSETAKVADDMIGRFNIKVPNRATAIKSLSGGNCQKVVVARETYFSPKLIVASEPSRGVDIGAINTIHNHMIDLRNTGAAILLISSSLDEIFALSDRIAVLFEGEIAAVLDPKTTTREEIGLYMSGAKKGGTADEVC